MTISPGPAPHVSILLVNWNTRELTRACLESLPRSIDSDLTYETVVIDNGSSDGSVELLRRWPGIDLVENEQNTGYAAAVNQAYARSSGEHILLLNSDIEFEPGALTVLVRFLAERPAAAGVGPLYLNPDGSEQQHHYRLPSFWMMLGGVSELLERLPPVARSTRQYLMLDEDFSCPRPVQQPSASVLLLRRSVLPTRYLLDEKFPIFFNDVELAYRLARSGHVLWMTPEARVIHVHGASTKLLGRGLVRQHLAAQIRYLRMTHSRSHVALFRSVVLVEKLSALLLRRPGALPPRELFAALRGDPGPLAQVPRD